MASFPGPLPCSLLNGPEDEVSNSQPRIIVINFTIYLYRASIASFQAVGYEYAVEMTYPDLPEGTSGGLVNFTSQVQIYATCTSCLASVSYIALSPGLFPAFQHATSIETLVLGMGLGTSL